MSDETTWLACDMDDGVLRTGTTRGELVEWFLGRVCVPRNRLRRHSYGPGNYEYTAHEPGAESIDSVAILTADSAKRAGWNPDQRPLYPDPGHPYERAEREEWE